MLPLMPSRIQPKKLPASKLKLSSWTTQVKSKMDIAQLSIATLHTLPSNSLKSKPKSTEEPTRSSKKNQNMLNPVTHA
jgi:hypothetical protein